MVRIDFVLSIGSMMTDFDSLFKAEFEGKSIEERCTLHSEIITKLFKASGIPHPVAGVRWVHISQVVANDYNPNKVAKKEMQLLRISIKQDGYTQPCVCAWDDKQKKYVIIDGFHRYSIMRLCPDIAALTGGYLPVVILEKSLADRMASTVRHNRARGTHSVQGMSNMVFKMLSEGKTDAEICNALGLESEELVRLKYITGYARLYKDVNYSRAWVFNTPPDSSASTTANELAEEIQKDGGFEEE